MKKLYEPISALVNKGADLSNFLHALVHSPTIEAYSEGYVFLTARERESQITDGVFLRLPKTTAQLMAMRVNEGCLTSEIEISHYCFTTYEDIGIRYLDPYDEDLFEKNIKKADLEPFLEWTSSMPENFKLMKPIERLRTHKLIRTKFTYNVENIYIRTDSAILTPDLLTDPLHQRYPFLNSDHPAYSHAIFLMLEGKRELHINNKKSNRGFGEQFRQWASLQSHNLTDNMIKSMHEVGNSDCDRKKF